jgi:hypothetical protein
MLGMWRTGSCVCRRSNTQRESQPAFRERFGVSSSAGHNSGVIEGQIFDAAGVAEGLVAGAIMATALVGINDHGDVCGA